MNDNTNTRAELDKAKKQATALLKEIDGLQTKERYLAFCIKTLIDMDWTRDAVAHPIDIQRYSVVLQLLSASQEQNDYRRASCVAANRIQAMYKGFFELHEREADGEVIGDEDIEAAAEKVKSTF